MLKISMIACLAATSLAFVQSNPSAASGQCEPFPKNTNGRNSIGLGNEGGQNRKQSLIAMLSYNATFEICTRDWHDNTIMDIDFNLVGEEVVSQRLLKNTCTIVEAARINALAVLGAGVPGGQDTVGYTVRICTLSP